MTAFLEDQARLSLAQNPSLFHFASIQVQVGSYFCIFARCTYNYILFLMIKLNDSPSRSSSIVLDTGWHAISSPHCLHVTEGEVHIACFHSEGAADIIGHLSSDIKLSREIPHECDIVHGAPIFNANSIRNLVQIQAKNTWGNSGHLSLNGMLRKNKEIIVIPKVPPSMRY